MTQTTITPYEFARLATAIGEWGEANFGATTQENASDPALGFLEEIGELTHAILKKKQGIRGTPAEHDAAARDALGDIGIFLLHLWYRETRLDGRIRLEWGVMERYCGAPPNERDAYSTHSALARLASAAAHLLSVPKPAVSEIAADEYPEKWARAHELAIAASHNAASLLGVDFWPQVRETWERIVSKRNWVANPNGTPDPA
jgi:hypothetical protein